MIHQELENAILTIVMDRADKKNALVPEMYRDMGLALENASKPESGVKVIIVKGAANCFTAGNDVAQFAKAVNQSNPSLKDTYHFMHALLHCPLPVIAQVEGLAIGIGTTLLLHCDFVICHKNTKFAMPFINLGLVPEYASSFIIPRIAGNLVAKKLLMLGESFGSDQALEWGFVTKIADDNLQHEVDSLALKLANKPALALMQTKKLINHDTTEVSEHIDRELEIFVEAMQSPPAKEAFAAFLEKREINKTYFK
ncbi:enoyl-CoA hydratase-related protein [Glaciecola petra]|uniref:Enoyl-CoA hydratase-related protein n=1 Tax=Glaciecola petra TaxID=3075602 RepID=A0ABU2ZPS6_9ALTE|nr:enoyl-CoA hydratase-related protein [Aestuariibacter sp. P117]MDT0594354.1 enoyl-CoA hydratase-related protein [Aestuariibacter sp. P117]